MWVLLWLVAAGCGRIAFDARADGAAASGDDAPGGDATTPSGMRLYAATNAALYRVDTTTLEATHVVDLCRNLAGVTLGDVAFSASGALYGSGLADTGLFLIDRATGMCTRIANLSARMFGLAFVPAGIAGPGETLVGVGDDQNFYTVDLAGAANVVGPLGVAAAGDLDWTGTRLLFAVDGGAADRLAIIAPATGAVTDIGALGEDGIQGIAWLDGNLYAFSNGGDAMRVDPATGATLQVQAGGPAWVGGTAGP